MSSGIIALIIAQIIWGAGAPIFKQALENIPPFTLAFFRFLGAMMIYLPFAIRYKNAISKKDILTICVSSFFGIFINITFFFLGLQHAPSINEPIINAAGPIFLFICAVLLFKEKVNKKVLVGILIALIGVLFIVFSPIFFSNSPYSFGKIEGNMFYVIAVLAAVIDPMIMKLALKRIPPFVATFYAFLFGCMTFFPFMLAESSTWHLSQLNTSGLIGIIYGIIGSSALAYGLIYYGVSKIKLQEIGIFSYIQPISAVVLAMILLNEYPNIWYGIGAIFIILGILISEGKIYHHKIQKKIQEN